MVVDRPLTLVAEPGAVIDGGGLGDVVRIEAPDVTLRGFTVRHSARNVSTEPAGIRVTADRATIEDNRVEEVLYGIMLDSSDGHVVRRNHVTSIAGLPAERRGHGLYLWYTHGNLVEGNHVELVKDGLFLGFATGTVVQGNTVTQVRYGLHTMYAHSLVLRDNVFRDNVAGASLMYSRDLVVEGNEFSGNRSAASGYGLLLKDMDDVLLAGNRIHHNRLGLHLEGAPLTPGAFVRLTGNLIGFNQIAIDIFSTAAITATENTFIGNMQQVESRSGDLRDRNTWAVDGRGNYWDDYQGYDASGDGVGDLPYRYAGAFDDLVQRNEALRAHSFSVARTALDLAARWFPVYSPPANVNDPHPLMAPTIGMATAEAPSARAESLAAGVLLALLPLAVFVAGARAFGRRWSTC